MEVLRVVAHTAAALAGAVVVLFTLGSAVRTVVLPRGIPALLGRWVFLAVRVLFSLRAGRAPSYARRDHVYASYGPLSLLVLLQVWLGLTYGGFAAMFWGLGAGSFRHCLALSGSSLLTLGFVSPHGGPVTAVVFAEASLGLVLLALLITYLPSLYSSFSRREAAVTKLDVRAGAPPTGTVLLQRAWILGDPARAVQVFREWEDWFVDIEETHTSFPALSFFRSPVPEHSWITAAGAVLDAAALLTSTVDLPPSVDAQLTMRAGYLALRRIAQFFDIPFDADPSPGDPIRITRDEWMEARRDLEAAGIPVRGDLEAAWADFAGWRVNYDTVLIALATLTYAPLAPWSSDRSLIGGRTGPRLPLPSLRRAPRTPARPRNAEEDFPEPD